MTRIPHVALATVLLGAVALPAFGATSGQPDTAPMAPRQQLHRVAAATTPAQADVKSTDAKSIGAKSTVVKPAAGSATKGTSTAPGTAPASMAQQPQPTTAVPKATN